METNETVQTRQDRTSRIDRRKQIIQVLSYPYWQPFKLVQLALESNNPLIVDLDFAAEHCPGSYKRDIIEMIQSLEKLGLVTMSRDRAGQVAYEMCISETDGVARGLIGELYS